MSDLLLPCCALTTCATHRQAPRPNDSVDALDLDSPHRGNRDGAPVLCITSAPPCEVMVCLLPPWRGRLPFVSGHRRTMTAHVAGLQRAVGGYSFCQPVARGLRTQVVAYRVGWLRNASHPRPHSIHCQPCGAWLFIVDRTLLRRQPHITLTTLRSLAFPC